MIVILNEASGSSGGAKTVLRVAQSLRRAGIEPRVSVVSQGSETTELAARMVAAGERTVVAAGGDGTIRAVAQSLAGSDTALGVIPLGTLNHFAKDLGIPAEMDAATRTLAEGRVVRVDAGEVNGRVFVNNSSLGLYPSIVVKRRRRQKRGVGKWVALAWAVATVARRFPYLRVRLDADGRPAAASTPFVFIGNNEYEVEGLNLGKRAGLNAGRLWLYMAPHRPRRRDAVRLLLRALARRVRQDRDFFALTASNIRVDTPLSMLAVALDGEVALMRPPLEYRARPGALQVIVPGKA